MPRRSSARATATITVSPPPQNNLAQLSQPQSENFAILRTQWKWAAFSQFFFTFNHLFAMNDVTLADIEGDLANGTNIVLPRIMQRLLYTLSYDRKVSLDNWQTALRKQYSKRDPDANPIGPEPQKFSRFESTEADPGVPDVDTDLENTLSKGEDSFTDVDPPFTSSAANADDRTHSASSPGSSYRAFAAQGQGEDADEKMLDWLDLPMLTKLHSLYLLTEWQFQNSTRLRTLMRSDDDTASWRIEPIGYDSKHNAYWLIGADRLWIQRALPKLTSNLKRKRTEDAKAHGLPKQQDSTKRRRLQAEPTLVAKSVNNPVSNVAQVNGRGRAAKAQAKLKLDAQAKELAELNRQAALQANSPKTRSTVSSSKYQQKVLPPARSLGTRVSARLRGAQEDEWQPIPKEWLSGRSFDNGNVIKKTGLESEAGSVSDLTELSEETEENGVDNNIQDNDLESDAQEEQPSEIALVSDGKGAQYIPEDFVEWETICITLHDWEHIADHFEKATHYTEKALRKVLINNIVPIITEELKEIEKKRHLEEALVHRKRSSRIAIRESEKEEARAAARKRAEEDEKMSRARRLEVRLQKEEADRVRREAAREQRRQEREARESTRKRGSTSVEAQNDTGDNDLNSRPQSLDPSSYKAYQNGRPAGNGYGSGSRTPIGEDWELDCEICHRHGVNIDDGTPMMSCGACARWQHIICHDRADQHVGRPKRDWDVVEFFCQRCRSKRFQQGYHTPYTPQTPIYSPPVHHVFSPQKQIMLPRESGGRSQYVRSRYDTAHIGSQPQYPHNTSPGFQIQQPPSQTRAPISFSHYQPQDRGFSSTSKVPFQTYGDVTVQPQLQGPSAQSHATTIGNRQQPMPPAQALWNVTTPTHSYPATFSAGSETTFPDRYRQNRDNMSRNLPVVDPNWESHPQPEVPQHQFTPTQFRYHPSSYQSPS